MLIVASSASAVANTENAKIVNSKKSTVSFGVKGGFNSTMLFADVFHIGGDKIVDTQNNYKVGYFASAFLRFNVKKHFIQPEISYNINQASVYIDVQPNNASLIPENALIKSKMISIDFPLLYGYKFVDKSPYGMAVFIGPKIAWTWDKHSKIDYSGFYQKDINEKFKPLNYSAVFGLAVNISNIFCDFRYEIGLNNISDEIIYNEETTPSPYNGKKIIFKRRRNVLSFSVGFIF